MQFTDSWPIVNMTVIIISVIVVLMIMIMIMVLVEVCLIVVAIGSTCSCTVQYVGVKTPTTDVEISQRLLEHLGPCSSDFSCNRTTKGKGRVPMAREPDVALSMTAFLALVLTETSYLTFLQSRRHGGQCCRHLLQIMLH